MDRFTSMKSIFFNIIGCDYVDLIQSFSLSKNFITLIVAALSEIAKRWFPKPLFRICKVNIKYLFYKYMKHKTEVKTLPLMYDKNLKTSNLEV